MCSAYGKKHSEIENSEIEKKTCNDMHVKVKKPYFNMLFNITHHYVIRSSRAAYPILNNYYGIWLINHMQKSSC